MNRAAAALLFPLLFSQARPAEGQQAAKTAPAARTSPGPEAAGDGTPRWLKISGELRSRAEAPTGLEFTANRNDLDLLTRIRVGVRVMAGSRLRFAGEWQDSRGFGYGHPVPASAANRLDVRLAWLEAGVSEGAGWTIRAGRQALKFGKGRLVWDPDWSNTGRAFDAVRVTVAGRASRLDVFAGSVVVPRDGRFDRCDRSQMLSGLYGSSTLRSGVILEPYLLLKSQAGVRDERGGLGALDVYTSGLRVAAKAGRRFDWESEMAVQRGKAAGSAVRAWAAVWQASWQTGSGRWLPRLTAAYTFASGDDNPSDGRKGTFDTLYPTTHLRNGATDRIGWANIHDWMVQGEWRRGSRLRFSVSGHDFRLATLRDALYSPGGVALVRHPLASSHHVGWEIAATADYQLSRTVTAGAGCAHLFPGAFLRQAGKSGATQPYLFLSCRF